jgi:hypothetical protein
LDGTDSPQRSVPPLDTTTGLNFDSPVRRIR